MIKTTDNQQELFIVVDESDSVVGFRSRFDCHHDKKLIHRAINIALYNSKGQIALQKRSKTKDLYPSYYALSATGHVSKGETYQQAALREMKEEVGVEGVALEFVSRQLVEALHEKEMVTLFKADYDGPLDFQNEEVESMHWMGKEEIAHIKSRLTPCSHNSLKLLGWI